MDKRKTTEIDRWRKLDHRRVPTPDQHATELERVLDSDSDTEHYVEVGFWRKSQEKMCVADFPQPPNLVKLYDAMFWDGKRTIWADGSPVPWLSNDGASMPSMPVGFFDYPNWKRAQKPV